MSDTFLTHEEIATLTGWKNKRKQVEQLRKQGLPFWLNASNAPIVPRSAIDGRKAQAAPPKKRWEPPD